MKKPIYALIVASFFIFACSKDDNNKCDSCNGASGTKYEICENEDGTYTVTVGNETSTVTEGELEGLTPKQVIEFACEIDGELTF